MTRAAIDSDWTNDTCDHDQPVVATTPSAFDYNGAAPIRDYADGCQGIGPFNDEDVAAYRKERGL